MAEAVAAGVRRLVLLTASGVDQIDDHPLKAAEQAVRGSGVNWTILRPDWLAQNFSEGPWLPGVLAGTLALPTGDGRVPFINTEDIAEVATAALTEDCHNGQIYQLTGPRAIGFGEATDLIGKAAGRTVRYVDVAPEVFVERQVGFGVPPEVASLLAGVLVAVRDGGGTEVSGDVERALGRRPGPSRTTSPKPQRPVHWH